MKTDQEVEQRDRQISLPDCPNCMNSIPSLPEAVGSCH